MKNFDEEIAKLLKAPGSMVVLHRLKPEWDVEGKYRLAGYLDSMPLDQVPTVEQVRAKYGGGDYKFVLHTRNPETGRSGVRAVKIVRDVPGAPLPHTKAPRTPAPVQWSYLVTVAAVPCSRCATPLPFAHALCPVCGTQAAPSPELATLLRGPDRLDEIKDRWSLDSSLPRPIPWGYDDVVWLVAEIERLRKRKPT